MISITLKLLFASLIALLLSVSALGPCLCASINPSISGKVAFKNGSHASGVTVIVRYSLVPGSGRDDGEADAVTSTSGNYEFDNLAPGQYTIYASPNSHINPNPADWIATTAQSITTSTGSSATIPDIVLSSGAIVLGIVVDPDTKQPVPGIAFSIQSMTNYGGALDGEILTGVTDSQGSFRVHVWPGDNMFLVRKVPDPYTVGDFGEGHLVTVADGQTLTMDPFPLTKGLILSGNIADGAGDAISGVPITLQWSSAGSLLDRSVPVSISDTNGSFSINKLVPGSYRIDTGSSWAVVQPKSLSLPSTAPITIVVQKQNTTTVVGKVVDEIGNAVPGVDVQYDMMYPLSDGDYRSKVVSATSDADGKLTLDDVPVCAPKRAVASISRNAVSKDGYIYRSGGEVSENNNIITVTPIVVAQLGGVIEGTVFNGLDKPVAHAWVLSPDKATLMMPVQTDSTGHFELTGLAQGPVDLFAAKGDYFAQKLITVTGTPSPVKITLSPADPLPKVSDLNDIISLCSQLGASDPNLLITCASQIALTDQDAATKFLGSKATLTPNDFIYMVDYLSIENPKGLGPWGISLLKSANDSDAKVQVTLDLGISVAPTDLNSAAALFKMAKSMIALDHLNQQTVTKAMQLASLGFEIHSPDAQTIFDKSMAAYKAVMSQSQSFAQPSYASFFQYEFVQAMFGNLPRMEDFLESLPQIQRENSFIPILKELVVQDPGKAVQFFDDYTTVNGEGVIPVNYNRGACSVIPIIEKSDPKQALTLTNKLTDPSYQAQALTLIADEKPIDQASLIYQTAEDASTDQYNNQGYSPGCVAAHAWVRNKTLGTKLFQEAFDKVINGPIITKFGARPKYTEFAFYYARIDPGFSRLLLEFLYVQDQIPTQDFSGSVMVDMDIGAMSAVDVKRAKAMIDGISDQGLRSSVMWRIDDYIVATQTQRDTVPFYEWSILGRDLIPGKTTEW